MISTATHPADRFFRTSWRERQVIRWNSQVISGKSVPTGRHPAVSAGKHRNMMKVTAKPVVADVRTTATGRV
ncbi:MAG TPA: hypothetical protein VH502_08845 [Actinoplanes sp.]